VFASSTVDEETRELHRQRRRGKHPYRIYKIQNLINGKCYIGFTSHKADNHRMSQHACGKGNSPALRAAIQKYGRQNFSYETIYESFDLDHTLKIVEPFYIALFSSYGPDGYNLTAGGEGTFGYKRTPEQRAAMRVRRLGKRLSPEHRAKLSEAQKSRPKGVNHPLYGRKLSREHIDKVAAAKRGVRHSAETRQKQSESQRGEKAHGYGKTGAKHKHSRSYEIEFYDGRIVQFTGLAQFCRTYPGYVPCGISELAHRKTKSHRDIIRADLIDPTAPICEELTAALMQKETSLVPRRSPSHYRPQP